MNQDPSSYQLPAPCIIDAGIVVHKEDIRRLLSSLQRVRYVHILEGEVQSEGEGCVLEVFNDTHQSTLIANQALYLNVQSFDYLQLYRDQDNYFELVQENRQLRLIPLDALHHWQPDAIANLDTASLEAMVAQVLAARWDVHLDDEDSF
jgi:hypothetical protein